MKLYNRAVGPVVFSIVWLTAGCTRPMPKTAGLFQKGQPPFDRLVRENPRLIAHDFQSYLSDPEARRLYVQPHPLIRDRVNYTAASNGMMIRAILLRNRNDFGIVRAPDAKTRIDALKTIVKAVSSITPEEMHDDSPLEGRYMAPMFALANIAGQLESAAKQGASDPLANDPKMWKKLLPRVADIRLRIKRYAESRSVAKSDRETVSDYSKEMSELADSFSGL
ncbi:hypothetical protein EON81_08980 [bacterium]|nr:MAG: hypothetical protein EON81_08980 [bacterium]